jgi:hypothetical protein
VIVYVVSDVHRIGESVMPTATSAVALTVVLVVDELLSDSDRGALGTDAVSVSVCADRAVSTIVTVATRLLQRAERTARRRRTRARPLDAVAGRASAWARIGHGHTRGGSEPAFDGDRVGDLCPADRVRCIVTETDTSDCGRDAGCAPSISLKQS